MVRVNKPMAAVLALGLAIPTLATPSFAQQSDEGRMSRRAGKVAARLQCGGWENVPTHLG